MGQRLDDEPPVGDPGTYRARFTVHVDRHRVANVTGELDASTAPRFAAELDRLADDGGIVSVDFSDLEFCGVAGINVLFDAIRRLGPRGRLVIYDPTPMLARLIGITGLDQHADVVGRVVSAPHAAWANGIGHGSRHGTVLAGSVASLPGVARPALDAR
jgi:anti-anti-sigma factor